MSSDLHRVTIVGLGLIGGSWALALRKRAFKGRIIACDRTEVLDRARAARAMDEGTEDLGVAVHDADLVILATSVGGILDLLPQLRPVVSPHALITDVGSTKRVICERALGLFAGEPLFLGGHPLAGRERSGFENAEAELLATARYVLTPLSPDHLADARVKAFSALVESVGARPFIAEAAAHDRALAFLSHLPQLMSTGLASLVAEEGSEDFLPLELAATGFRDVTRLAESPYALWRDICLTNTENLQWALDAIIEKLEMMKLHLRDRDLESEFRRALELRARLRDTR